MFSIVPFVKVKGLNEWVLRLSHKRSAVWISFGAKSPPIHVTGSRETRREVRHQVCVQRVQPGVPAAQGHKP